MLDAFKIKEFDLQPVIDSWTNPPIFHGEPSRDMPVDDWLAAIKAGCSERKVPEEYWHKVGQRFMGPAAKARLEEIKTVMAKVNGGKYRWSWKKFSIAMKNMGWEIDPKATESVQVTSRTSGIFWITRKKSKDAAPPVPPKEEKEDKEDKENRPHPERSSSTSWLTTMKEKRKPPTRSNTDTALLTSLAQVTSPAVSALKTRTPPSRSNSIDMTTTTEISSVSAETTGAVTQVQNAPTWLLNACSALDFLTSEHPRAMSTISAILITAGTLPTIPAIAGGTVLASGVAQAVGAIAVGVGNMLKAQQDGRVEMTNGQQQAQAAPQSH